VCTWLYVVVVMTCVYGTKISRVEKKHVASHYLLHCMCVRSGIYNDVYMAVVVVVVVSSSRTMEVKNKKIFFGFSGMYRWWWWRSREISLLSMHLYSASV